MPWDPTPTTGSQTGIGPTWTDLFDVTLTPGESLHAQLEVDNEAGTITDPVDIRIVSTLDDTTPRWDDVSLGNDARLLPPDTNPLAISIPVSGYYRVKYQARSGGSTDLYTVAWSYRADGIDQ